MGICDVFNGNTFGNTFTRSSRTDIIRNFTDSREGPFQPKMINGTGKLHEVQFLLNIGGRSLANHNFSVPQMSSEAWLAINDWRSYFNVRTNYFQVNPGQRMDIVIQPVNHIASEDFKNLNKEDRDCLFRDEHKVRNNSLRFSSIFMGDFQTG